MKKLLYLFIITGAFLASCSNIPDDLYYFDDWQDDKVMLQAELSEENFDFIYAWIYTLTNNETVKNNSIEGKTYRELFKIFKELKEKNEKISELEYRIVDMIDYDQNINNRIIDIDLFNLEPYIKFTHNNELYLLQSSIDEIDSFRDFEALLESSKLIEKDKTID